MIAPNTTLNSEPATLKPPPTPLQLVQFLTQQEQLDIQATLEHFHITPAELHELVKNPETQQLIQMAEDLSKAQMRLRLAHAVPKALAAFEKILQSDKPETARRAANTLCQLAGLLPIKSRAVGTRTTGTNGIGSRSVSKGQTALIAPNDVEVTSESRFEPATNHRT